MLRPFLHLHLHLALFLCGRRAVCGVRGGSWGEQDHGIDQRIDYRIMEEAKEALENKTPVSLKMPISNLDRTTGTILSYNISTK